MIQGIITFQVLGLSVRSQLGAGKFPLFVKLIQIVSDHLFTILGYISVLIQIKHGIPRLFKIILYHLPIVVIVVPLAALVLPVPIHGKAQGQRT